MLGYGQMEGEQVLAAGSVTGKCHVRWMSIDLVEWTQVIQLCPLPQRQVSKAHYLFRPLLLLLCVVHSVSHTVCLVRTDSSRERNPIYTQISLQDKTLYSYLFSRSQSHIWKCQVISFETPQPALYEFHPLTLQGWDQLRLWSPRYFLGNETNRCLRRCCPPWCSQRDKQS